MELSDGRSGHVKTTTYGLVDGSTRYGVTIGGAVVNVDESDVTRIVEHGQHAYWKPDPRRVPASEMKRGHCYRCGIKKASHP